MPGYPFLKMTNYLEEKVAGMLRGTSWTAPTTLYLAHNVHDSLLGNTGVWDETGVLPANGREPNQSPYADTNYARYPMTGSMWAAPASTDILIGEPGLATTNLRTVQPLATIQFPPASYNYVGTPTSFAFYDAPTGGNALLYGDFQFLAGTGHLPGPAQPGRQLTIEPNFLKFGFANHFHRLKNPDDSFRNYQMFTGPTPIGFPPVTNVIDGILNHVVNRASYVPNSWFLVLVVRPLVGDPYEMPGGGYTGRIDMNGYWTTPVVDAGGFAFWNTEIAWSGISNQDDWRHAHAYLYNASASGLPATAELGSFPSAIANGDTARIPAGKLKFRAS